LWNHDQLRALRAPPKQRYRDEPTTGPVTLEASVIVALSTSPSNQ
jgi:hypothetical protein